MKFLFVGNDFMEEGYPWVSSGLGYRLPKPGSKWGDPFVILASKVAESPGNLLCSARVGG